MSGFYKLVTQGKKCSELDVISPYFDHHFKSENPSEGIVQVFEHLQKRDYVRVMLTDA